MKVSHYGWTTMGDTKKGNLYLIRHGYWAVCCGCIKNTGWKISFWNKDRWRGYKIQKDEPSVRQLKCGAISET